MKKCELQILSQTTNGKIFRCLTCKQIHIEYKNLNFTFSKDDFVLFREYFLELNPEVWAHKNRNTVYTRKIMVPIGHRNFTAMFHTSEIYELKELFKKMKRDTNRLELIGLDNIESHSSLN